MTWLVKLLFRRNSNIIDVCAIFFGGLLAMDANWLGGLCVVFAGSVISALGERTLNRMTRCGKQGK